MYFSRTSTRPQPHSEPCVQHRLSFCFSFSRRWNLTPLFLDSYPRRFLTPGRAPDHLQHNAALPITRVIYWASTTSHIHHTLSFSFLPGPDQPNSFLVGLICSSAPSHTLQLWPPTITSASPQHTVCPTFLPRHFLLKPYTCPSLGVSYSSIHVIHHNELLPCMFSSVIVAASTECTFNFLFSVAAQYDSYYCLHLAQFSTKNMETR